MITQSNNLAIVDQVAKLFFPNETLQQNVVKERLKNFLTDDIFQIVLGLLSTGRTYLINDTGMIRVKNQPPEFKISNHYMDLFLGDSGNGFINNIPAHLLANKQKIYQRVGLVYIGSLAVNGISYDVVQNQTVENYGVTYVPTINPGGSGTNGDPIRGGLITVNPTTNGNELQSGNAIKPTGSIFDGLDLNSLLIPGVVLGVLYFVSKK